MKITIDASQIVYGTGVSVYTKNLIRSLLRLDKENEYLIIGGSLRKIQLLKETVLNLINGNSKAEKLIFPLPPTAYDFLFNRFNFLKIDNLIGKTDVFHSSDWVQPASSAFNVTTIHDLIPLKYSNIVPRKIVDVHKRRLERVKRYVDQIIVPSITTKLDLVNLGFEENRINVIPEAVDEDFRKPKKESILKIMRKYRLNFKYLLAVGTHQRKNLDRIIAAFEQIRALKPMKLVVIGEQKKHFNTRNVVFLGHIPDQDRASIYSQAQALVYPSLYEGFGLPILEAFYLNVPVLTSDLGSMREISGSAAVLVDPNSVNGIKEGIIKILNSRKDYIRKGRIELKRYSWNKTALETLKIYNKYLK